MEDAAPSAGTHWRKLTLAAALLMVAVVLAGIAGHRAPEALFSIGPLAALVAHVGYYNGIVKTEYFSDWEFTIFVDIGFFVALLGIGWGFGALIGLERFRISIMANVGMAVLVGMAVILLYGWTKENKAKLEEPLRDPIPEATTSQ
jgi:hypothetical protein